MKQLLYILLIFIIFPCCSVAQVSGVVVATYYDSVYMHTLNGDRMKLPESFEASLKDFDNIEYEQAFPYSQNL